MAKAGKGDGKKKTKQKKQVTDVFAATLRQKPSGLFSVKIKTLKIKSVSSLLVCGQPATPSFLPNWAIEEQTAK